MKFSYSTLKKFVPALKDIDQLRDILNLHAFEVDSVEGDILDVKILPNRFSDAASYAGLAREAAAILNTKVAHQPSSGNAKFQKASGRLDLIVEVQDHGLCPRYMARYFELDGGTKTPDWMVAVLKSAEMRSINPVVDVMNYVMLETGQPMHAFDADKVKSILVRRARTGEKLETLDGGNYELNGEDLVIADGESALAIAGVKGGRRAEVTEKTTRIIVESANFNGSAVYGTSKRLRLVTDASARFAHNLSPALAENGLARATALLAEVVRARVGEVVDSYPKKIRPTSLNFSIADFTALTGLALKEKEALGYLQRLGFKVSGRRVTAPPERTDVFNGADLADEIVRLYGYDKLPAIAPFAALRPTEHDDSVKLKALLRGILMNLGLTETYNYSFVSGHDLEKFGESAASVPELLNPISAEFQYLRPNLAIGLLKNCEDNFRFAPEARLFEIGRTFALEKGEMKERLSLGIALAAKKSNPLLALKGIVSILSEKLGLSDFSEDPAGAFPEYIDKSAGLRIESDHHVLGYLGTTISRVSDAVAIAEIDLGELLSCVTGEREYEPIPKFPAVDRDISFIIGADVRVGDVLQAIQDASPKLIYDVDLLDYYQDDSKMNADEKSLTFRIIFQADDRTLTDEEVGHEMEKIISVLREKFNVEVR
jgi:phenylalanyl-tRNA synthetase beta chain